MIDDDEHYPCDDCDNLCDEWERQYCCELCRYYGGGDKMSLEKFRSEENE